MTSWGAYDGGIRVGIDWTISPANPSHDDTSVKVTWQFYVGADHSIDDDESIVAGGTNFANTTTNFHNGLSGGGSKLVWTHSETYGIDYSSGSVSAHVNLNGAYNGSNASKTVTVNLPDRPKAAPSAPTWDDPAIVSITKNSASLHGIWGNDNGGDPAFQAQFQVDENPNFTSPMSQTDSTIAHNFTGLSPGTTYTARIRTQNSIGWSPWTPGTRSFTTDNDTTVTVPAAPVMVSPPRVDSSSSIGVDWSTPANGGAALTDVQNQVATDSAFTNVINTYDPGAWATGIEWTGLNPSTIYYFRARAKNSQGWGPWSTGVSATTSAPATSNPPQQPVVPSVSSTTTTTAKVSFQKPASPDAPISSYDFQVATNNTFTAGLINFTGEPATIASPFQATGLTPNTNYFVRFRANNANGAGQWSDASAQFHTQVSGSDGTLVQKIRSGFQAVGDALQALTARVAHLERSAMVIPATANLGSPIPTTYTTIPGVSANLPAGTYVVIGTVTLISGTPSGNTEILLHVNGAAQAGSGLAVAANASDRKTITQSWIITLATTQAVELRAISSVAANTYTILGTQSKMTIIPTY